MEEITVDQPEYEKQKREAIINGGHYAKFEVIVEDTKLEDLEKSPVSSPYISLTQNCSGPVAIAQLYITLRDCVKILNEQYPLECNFGELAFDSERLGVTTEENEED